MKVKIFFSLCLIIMQKRNGHMSVYCSFILPFNLNYWMKLLNECCVVAQQKVANQILKKSARMICKTILTSSHILRII